MFGTKKVVNTSRFACAVVVIMIANTVGAVYAQSEYEDVFWPDACFAYTDLDACLDYYCASYWDIDGHISYYSCLADPFSFVNPYEDVFWPEDCSLYEETELCLNYYCASYWDIDGHISYYSCLADPFVTTPNSPYEDVFWPDACFAYTDLDACLDYYCASYWDIDGHISYYSCLADPFSFVNPYEDVFWPEDCSLYEETELCLNYYCASYWDIDGHISYYSCLADPFVTTPNSPYEDVFWPDACFAYTDLDACLDYYCASYWDIDGHISYYSCLADPFSFVNPYEDVFWPEDCSLYEETELCLNYYCASYWDIDGHISYYSCLADPFVTTPNSPYEDVFWPEDCSLYTDHDACLDYYCESYWDVDGFRSYYSCLADPFAYILIEEPSLPENDAVVETDQLLYTPTETVHLTGFHGLQYAGLAEISIIQDDSHVVDEFFVSTTDGFFSADVYIDSSYLPGTYYVFAYDDAGNFVSSTLFAVLDILEMEQLPSPTAPFTENNIIIQYEDASDSYHTQIKEWLELNEHKVINPVAITDYLVLPYENIPVSFSMCGEENAFYYPATSSITMCYELAAHYLNEFRNIHEDSDHLSASVFGALHWVFLHEMGHALIDIYDIPITGKEEDSADQFATHMVLQEEMGLDTLLSMVYLYGSSESSSLEWGVHSSDKQRYYNILCTVYGSDPVEFEFLVEDGILPERRAVYCPDEYDKTISSWTRLLADYIRG